MPRKPLSRSGSPATQKSGSLVAVEGDIQTVSTQLRLLPPSSKILVLPPLLDDVAGRVEDTPFNARSFVRDVHTAFNTRAETARTFLKSSTNDQPRLVFLNGGSVCARATCIANICENVTNGEIWEAEALFHDIVKDGVAGLMRVDEETEAGHELAENKDVEARNTKVKDFEGQDGEHGRSSSDAGSAAMRAADELDRITAELQPSDNDELEDDAMMDAAHSYAQDVKRSTNDQQESGKTETKGAEDVEEAASSLKASRIIARLDRALFTDTPGTPIRRTIISLPRRPSQPVEDEAQGSARDPEPQTPHTATSSYTDVAAHHDNTDSDFGDAVSPSIADQQHSTPATPGAVVEYGEACIVDVQSANIGEKFRRIQSVDRIYRPRQDLSPASPHRIKHAYSYQDLRQKRSLDSDSNTRPDSRVSFETPPRSTFMRASQFTIKPSLIHRKASITPVAPKIYVDHGTDAEVIKTGEPVLAEPFEPVFPVIEDLVIHFSNSNVNEIFESVVRSYKDASYPVFPSTEVPETEQTTASSTPSTTDESQVSPRQSSWNTVAETVYDDYSRKEEIDPYNPESYHASLPTWPNQRRTKNLASMRAEPPTPATTPPLIMSEVAQKFHEFSPVNANSAVGVQNSLRSVLNIHYGPAETTKYRQYEAPLECDRLWKPVFRIDNGNGSEGRTIDLVLAIGCEDGVDVDFFNEISAQVEKLGTRKSGISLTGKLDIRYLIAIAMQSHTMQPLTAQSATNPFGNPMALATTLLPHLETYLAVNNPVRFLILTYPASHLSTIISLRKLLGSDILKVSGIIDALASDPPSFAGRASPPPPLNLLSNDGTTSLNNRHKPVMSIGSFARTRAELARQASAAHAYSISNTSSKRSSTQVDPSFSFAKANFLLPSTATDAEISTFLGSISKILIEKSQWYTPEAPSPPALIVPAAPIIALVPPPIPPTPDYETAENAPRSPMAGTFTTVHKPRRSLGGRPSKIDQLLGGTSSSRSNTLTADAINRVPAERVNTSHSLAPSTKTIETSSSERERQADKAWENFYLGPDGESDDEYDRMLMPRLPKRADKKKGNSRKALKWLGLA